jgi:hypothetical protein
MAPNTRNRSRNLHLPALCAYPVNGDQNHLADIISRNPAGLNAIEIRDLTKPNTILVNGINLNIDRSVCKDLRNLTEIQKTDPMIQRIWEIIVRRPTVPEPRYQLVDDNVFYREAGRECEWKPVIFFISCIPMCYYQSKNGYKWYVYTHQLIE